MKIVEDAEIAADGYQTYRNSYYGYQCISSMVTIQVTIRFTMHLHNYLTSCNLQLVKLLEMMITKTKEI